jgi:Ca2+-binding EF-hand superfamily protein
VLHRVLKETLTGIDEEFRLNFSAFLLYDEDGDGFISTSDMQTFATLRQGESLSYSQAESIVSEALHSRHGYAKDLRTIPYQVRDGPLRLCYEDFVAWQATG